jgi:pimeloyl-ACP methyl ester carboxylesterase
MAEITYHKIDVDGFNIFYRAAGAPDAPKLLLLHGFPTASHMFRNLIPLLADQFHVIAPDLPGFGNSDMPGSSCTFDLLAEKIDRFTEILGISHPFWRCGGRTILSFCRLVPRHSNVISLVQ